MRGKSVFVLALNEQTWNFVRRMVVLAFGNENRVLEKRVP